MVSRLSRDIARLNKREAVYEKRLERQRATEEELRLEIQQLSRALEKKDDEIAAEKERHKSTRILSEKRRQACVKLRNQGVSLVRTNNSLETRKIMGERALKHELKTCNLTLAETRVALQESQGALTTLQRELLRYCKRGRRGRREQRKGIPKKLLI